MTGSIEVTIEGARVRLWLRTCAECGAGFHTMWTQALTCGEKCQAKRATRKNRDAQRRWRARAKREASK